MLCFQLLVVFLWITQDINCAKITNPSPDLLSGALNFEGQTAPGLAVELLPSSPTASRPEITSSILGPENGNLVPEGLTTSGSPLPGSQVDVFSFSNGPQSAGMVEALRENMENRFLMQQIRSLGGLGADTGTGMSAAMGIAPGATDTHRNGMGMNSVINQLVGMMRATPSRQSAAFHHAFSPNMHPGFLMSGFPMMSGRAMMPPMGGGMSGGMGFGTGMGVDPAVGMGAAAAGGVTVEPVHCPKWARMFCGATECGHDAEWIPLHQCRVQMGMPMCRCLLGPTIVKCCPMQ